MGKSSIILVAAHPDDIECGMGGTAMLLSRTYQLHMICASKGERGYDDPQGRKGIDRPPRDDLAAVRERELRASCSLMGAALHFLDEIDGEIYAGKRSCARAADIMRDLAPVAVFALWPVNVPDHVAASVIATKAMQLAGMQFTSELYYYETTIGGQTNQFEPDIYVDISGVIEGKRALCRCHGSQGYDTEEGLSSDLQNNVIRGRLARTDYAEGFRTGLSVVNQRWGRQAGYCLLNLHGAGANGRIQNDNG